MTLKIKFILAFLGFFLLNLHANLLGNTALSALEIVQKSESIHEVGDVVADLTVEITRPSWNKNIKLKTWAKGTDYAMAYIIAPERDKGTVFLKAKDEVYNYLPKVKKVIKMPMNLLSQNWMGTDMTTDDLIKGTQFSKDYNAKKLTEESVNGRLSYKLELLPKDNAEVLWGKVLLWVDKASFNQMQMKFYDEDLDLVHTISGSDLKVLGGKLIVSKYEMVPADKKGYKTILKYQNLDFKQNLDLSFFSKDNMKNVRP